MTGMITKKLRNEISDIWTCHGSQANCWNVAASFDDYRMYAGA